MGDGWRMDFSKTHFDSHSPPDFYVKVGSLLIIFFWFCVHKVMCLKLLAVQLISIGRLDIFVSVKWLYGLNIEARLGQALLHEKSKLGITYLISSSKLCALQGTRIFTET